MHLVHERRPARIGPDAALSRPDFEASDDPHIPLATRDQLAGHERWIVAEPARCNTHVPFDRLRDLDVEPGAIRERDSRDEACGEDKPMHDETVLRGQRKHTRSLADANVELVIATAVIVASAIPRRGRRGNRRS